MVALPCSEVSELMNTDHVSTTEALRECLHVVSNCSCTKLPCGLLKRGDHIPIYIDTHIQMYAYVHRCVETVSSLELVLSVRPGKTSMTLNLRCPLVQRWHFVWHPNEVTFYSPTELLPTLRSVKLQNLLLPRGHLPRIIGLG